MALRYGLPYVVVRPFNAVGIGERRAREDCEVSSGNVKLAMSHVVPDLVQKVSGLALSYSGSLTPESQGSKLQESLAVSGSAVQTSSPESRPT